MIFLDADSTSRVSLESTGSFDCHPVPHAKCDTLSSGSYKLFYFKK